MKISTGIRRNPVILTEIARKLDTRGKIPVRDLGIIEKKKIQGALNSAPLEANCIWHQSFLTIAETAQDHPQQG